MIGINLNPCRTCQHYRYWGNKCVARGIAAPKTNFTYVSISPASAVRQPGMPCGPMGDLWVERLPWYVRLWASLLLVAPLKDGRHLFGVIHPNGDCKGDYGPRPTQPHNMVNAQCYQPIHGPDNPPARPPMGGTACSVPPRTFIRGRRQDNGPTTPRPAVVPAPQRVMQCPHCDGGYCDTCHGTGLVAKS